MSAVPTSPKSVRDVAPIKPSLQEVLEPRVQRLMAIFNGAIKYLPMLMDHDPECQVDPKLHWTDEQCVEFARELHAIAIERLRSNVLGWNHGIPYCRNIPTAAMLKEAGR